MACRVFVPQQWIELVPPAVEAQSLHHWTNLWWAETKRKKEFNHEGWESVQFSSVTQSCPTLCDPMNRSTPGLPVHHHLPELAQTHVH